jgi:hypothetical protein
MDKYKDIYERYLKANQTWRFIFVDLLNDLIGWIGAIDELINYCMEHQELMDIMFTPEHKADIIRDFKVWELSW